MDYEQWEQLKHDLAIEVIANDLLEIMTPYSEGRKRAEESLSEGNQEALNVEHRMGQALIALEKMGYVLIEKGRLNLKKKELVLGEVEEITEIRVDGKIYKPEIKGGIMDIETARRKLKEL